MVQSVKEMSLFGVEVEGYNEQSKTCPLEIVPNTEICGTKYGDIEADVIYTADPLPGDTGNELNTLVIQNELLLASKGTSWTQIVISALVSGAIFSVLSGITVFLAYKKIHDSKKTSPKGKLSKKSSELTKENNLNEQRMTNPSERLESTQNLTSTFARRRGKDIVTEEITSD